MSDPNFTKSSVVDPNEFDPEQTDIDTGLQQRSDFSETLATHGFSDILVLGRDRAADVFHERRLQIIDYLDESEPESVRALARDLEHDKGTVSRDLDILAQLDIIEFIDKNKAKAPRLKHRHIAVEPIL